MEIVIYPPDPDCPKCKGSGAITDCSAKHFSYRKCDCARYENIQKIRDRCDHEYVCKKCGKGSGFPGIPFRGWDDMRNSSFTPTPSNSSSVDASLKVMMRPVSPPRPRRC